MKYNTYLKSHLDSTARLEEISDQIEQFAACARQTIEAGNKILVFGNGGSAADAQHFAAELTGRFLSDRSPLACIALTTDTSAITAIGNDYGFDAVFLRQVEALAQPGDLLLGISTSGNSNNVLNALNSRPEMKLARILLTSERCIGPLDVQTVKVPCSKTYHIQEMHMIVLHYVCMSMEAK